MCLPNYVGKKVGKPFEIRKSALLLAKAYVERAQLSARIRLIQWYDSSLLSNTHALGGGAAISIFVNDNTHQLQKQV